MGNYFQLNLKRNYIMFKLSNSSNPVMFGIIELEIKVPKVFTVIDLEVLNNLRDNEIQFRSLPVVLQFMFSQSFQETQQFLLSQAITELISFETLVVTILFPLFQQDEEDSEEVFAPCQCDFCKQM